MRCNKLRVIKHFRLKRNWGWGSLVGEVAGDKQKNRDRVFVHLKVSVFLLRLTFIFLEYLCRNSSIDRTGMFANRDLEPGDIIIVEDPVLIRKTSMFPTVKEYVERHVDLLSQFDQLDPGTQVSYLYHYLS